MLNFKAQPYWGLVTLTVLCLIASPSSIFADHYCKDKFPDWKLEGDNFSTDCSIRPHYYTVFRDLYFSRECQNGTCDSTINPHHTFGLTDTEDTRKHYSFLRIFAKDSYDSCVGNDIYDGELLSGSEMEYYWNHCYLGCVDFYEELPYPNYYFNLFICDPIEGFSLMGGWDAEYECKLDENDDTVAIYNFKGKVGETLGNHTIHSTIEEEVTVTAIFDRPEACLPTPELSRSKYQTTVNVKSKDGSCCPLGKTQTIILSCSEADHVRILEQPTGGELYKVNISESDLSQCDESGCGGNSVKVVLEPLNNMVKYEKKKTETATLSCVFYDFAGNEIKSGTASVEFVLTCPPENK
ncbi:hypothetical protein SMSP2_01812 [Limihaloglobus sulfuriphilus]|uniref:Uncharacterized protein n=1 Tax=Limihaloglobus sulfuriphilus TaxID=1851148 RepID=A0A1Q2MFW1_9BACT|nr:hypothetical protein [Limihaloglobus sulfuriphilus]AQQ71438.1 hypothetical protein SMSP2_01812 [Limihaloglobus sulfuriphilus]